MSASRDSLQSQLHIEKQPVRARDTHALPPDHVCDAYWKYNKAKPSEINDDPAIIDFRRGLSEEQQQKLRVVMTVPAERITDAYMAFKDYGATGEKNDSKNVIQSHPCTAYEHGDLPGLRLYPGLLPPEAQMLLVSRVMHRDLANPNHTTNINLDYQVPYPAPRAATSSPCSLPDPSFFTSRQTSKDEILTPKDASPSSKLKPLNMSQYLQKKLRWLTLGDQYQWATRSYSGADITPFPPDIAEMVKSLFPGLRPESGVVLLYSKTDYMPVHRDVSEVCERGLASFSLGCDGLFVVAKDTNEGDDDKSSKTVVVRVRSGDVVQMSGETRWAWHAMPKIIPGTCPEFMARWPAGTESEMGEKEGAYEQWRGYMSGKRINISCRQVWD